MLTTNHLLIVDDDPDDRELFIEAIKEIDPSIVCATAANGIDAIKWLNNANHTVPNLIFLDISMPLLNGRHCLTQIKSDPRLADIPVIIYTTSRDIEESAELKKMGALHFMSKPRDANEIYYLAAVALEQYLYNVGSD